MQIDVFDDILDLIVYQIDSITDLKRLFCVNKGFQALCKERFITMNRDFESQLRHEIQYLLTPESSSLEPIYSQVILKTLLFREYLLSAKQVVLDIAESVYKSETKSKLDFRELKGKSKKSKIKDSKGHVVKIGWCSSVKDAMTTRVLLLCRSNTDDSQKIRSKVQTLTRTMRNVLDTAILEMNTYIQSNWCLPYDADCVQNIKLHKAIRTCTCRVVTLMDYRTLIGARTLTLVTSVNDPAQVQVTFVSNCGRIPVPFTQIGI
jgi:hypothetical protein